MEHALEAPRSSWPLQWLEEAWHALMQVREHDARARALARFDARILKDIGLELHACDQRRYAALQAAAFRIGVY